jgi:hypothetical protein
MLSADVYDSVVSGSAGRRRIIEDVVEETLSCCSEASRQMVIEREIDELEGASDILAR